MRGCFVAALFWVVFYGGVGTAFITLGFYPVLYVLDAQALGEYQTSPACESTTGASACRGRTYAEVRNLRSFDGRPNFDVQDPLGKPVSVVKNSGAYAPRPGDRVQVEFWHGNPTRVFGPSGEELITDQYPAARLQTDRDVLGLFLVLGLISLTGAVASGWFGRRLLFPRLVGAPANTVWKGIAVVAVILVVVVPVTIWGQASGWLPAGRAGGAVVGVAIVLLIVLFAAVRYAYRRAHRDLGHAGRS